MYGEHVIKLRKGPLVVAVIAALAFGAVWSMDSVRSRSSRQLARADVSIDIPARRAARGERVPLFINARHRPVALKPTAGLEDTVTDKQLLKALCAALPMWHPPTVPSLIHELLLWGRNADFTKAMVGQARSGAMIVETLLSDKLCRERTTPNGASFLIDSPFGINVVLAGTADAKENRAEGHYGQLLKVLGEAGVPLDTPAHTASGRSGTVADILQDAILRFGWAPQLEFIGTALALWLPPEATWTDQFGNRYSFDELMEHLMLIPWGKGPCGGCHVPQAVVVILAVDRRYPLLSISVRERALRWLADLSAELEKSERPEGGWDETWPGEATVGPMYLDPVLDRLTVTGHHLEWVAMAPTSVRPSKAVIKRAVAACIRDIDRLPPMRGRSFKTILPCSHLARALCLIRDKDPYTVWIASWSGKRLKSGEKGYELRGNAVSR